MTSCGKVCLLWAVCASTACASNQSAFQALHAYRDNMPSDPMAFVEAQLEASQEGDAQHPGILVVGDSWAATVGAGGRLGMSFLQKKLREHGCDARSSSIAVPGTTTDDWANTDYLKSLKKAAATHEYVFIILVGNDALMDMPDCASTKKSAADCGDQLMAKVSRNMLTIVDAIHEANPRARVVGFGYDTMFGGTGCHWVARSMFPQCWSRGVPYGGGNRCFNTQFLRIQEMWDNLAKNRSFVDSASILGATQVAAGDTKASTDPADRHIDMDKMGPAKYWPLYEGCFHPSIFGGDKSGAMIVMEEFYKVYWSKHLKCSKLPSEVVV